YALRLAARKPAAARNGCFQPITARLDVVPWHVFTPKNSRRYRQHTAGDGCATRVSWRPSLLRPGSVSSASVAGALARRSSPKAIATINMLYHRPGGALESNTISKPSN